MQGLDGLVEVLGGLVGSVGARGALEGNSRLRLREDGLSLTSVPEILSEVQHVTSNKLSGDQLNKVNHCMIALISAVTLFIKIHTNMHEITPIEERSLEFFYNNTW